MPRSLLRPALDPASPHARGGTVVPLQPADGGHRPSPAPAEPFHLDVDERWMLDRLRWFAMRSALAARPDLEEACFLLAGDPLVSLERYGILFFRGLSRTARRRVAFYRPGARSLGRDEAWLVRLVRAYRDGDLVSARALIAWHVCPDGQRWMRFLAEGLTTRLLAGA